MRKSLIILLLFGQTLFGQGWCPKGATWYFNYSIPFPPFLAGNGQKQGQMELKYTGDVLVGSIRCKVIVGTFYGYVVGTNPSINVHPNYRTYYVYEGYKTILLHRSGGLFDTVVDFGAKIGDKWRRAGGCGDVLTVTDTGRVYMYSQSLKQIKTSHTYTYVSGVDSSIITADNGVTFVENFFFKSSSPEDELFGTSCYRYIPSHIVDYYPPPTASFVCYQDDFTNIRGCEPYIVIGTPELSHAGEFSIYPVPAMNSLTIKSNNQKPYRIKIFSELGQLSKDFSFIGGELSLDVSDLPGGLYLLQAYSNGVLQVSKKFSKF